MTIDDLKTQIKIVQAEEDINKAAYLKSNSERKRLEIALAHLESPFKINDIIQWGRNIKYKGKIVKVVPSYKNWNYIVQRIKKDGSDGSIVEIHSYDYHTIKRM